LFFSYLPAHIFLLIADFVMPVTASGALSASENPGPLTGFDRVAWFYDALAGLVFGPALRNAQRTALAGLPAGSPVVLILGGGTGWVLTEVLRRRPAATVLYVEASPRMLAQAEARLRRDHPAAAHQVTFRHGTQHALQPSERFDAIITFFVLDCIALPELEGALERLRAAQQPGAPWLLADFRPAQRGWRKLLLTAMYFFFRLTTGLQARELPDLRAALLRLGLRPATSRLFFGNAVEAVIFAESPNSQQP
jgi:tRNA (cmo5U34)-methyltransferase